MKVRNLTGSSSLSWLNDRHKCGSERLWVNIEWSFRWLSKDLSLLLQKQALLLFPHFFGIEFVEYAGHDVLPSYAIVVSIAEAIAVDVLASVLLSIVILRSIGLSLLSSFDGSLCLGHFLAHLIEVQLIWGGISMMVVQWPGFLLIDDGVIFGNRAKASQSSWLTLIDVHVLELWREYSTMLAKLSDLTHINSLSDVSSFGEFLLVHAKLFLMFLKTNIDAVDQNLRINVIMGLSETALLGGLFLQWLL